MAFRVTRGSSNRLLPSALGVSGNSPAGLAAPQVADDSTDARTYSILQFGNTDVQALSIHGRQQCKHPGCFMETDSSIQLAISVDLSFPFLSCNSTA